MANGVYTSNTQICDKATVKIEMNAQKGLTPDRRVSLMLTNASSELTIVTPTSKSSVTILTEGLNAPNAWRKLGCERIPYKRKERASQDLINGTLALDGESLPSNLYAINGIPIDTKKTAYEQTCAIYLSDRGQCDNNYACVVVDERPSCESVKKDDDLGLVLGLGIGIPLGLIACLAAAVIIIYALRNRRRKQSTDNERDSINNGFFTRGIPVKIDTWGRHDPSYKQQSRQWDSSSSSNFSDDYRSSRLYKGIEYPAYRGIDYPAQDRYVYDNQQQPSNFSWDFIYKYISPDDSYRIQRPVTERRPNPIFEGTNM
ncbi:hypothetical protein DPMN_076372 [Dreissena polymorpha]|uniref:Uncharacterized protein n=1 Tax=Dreissena polymorpha TaxID=45954 RepID=A0A9D4BQG0_DREPO|nr:hypothetical protein DPMN_076372 [Dreissena polymorpha]